MKKLILFIIASILLVSCSSDKMVKSPVDELIRSKDQEKNFTIVLYDMDIEDNLFSDTYKHKYKVMTPKPTGKKIQVINAKGETMMVEKDTMMVSYTDWQEVDEDFFNLHSSDMGMEIAHKKNGVLKKEVAPQGYSQYVGNPQYGQWSTNSSGGSFWQFYGQYMFMRSMFNLATFPIYSSMYSDYGRYRSMGRPYYGGTTTAGAPRYGTFSTTTSKMNPSFSSRMASNNSFSSKVASKVSKSSSAAKSGSRSVTSAASKVSRSSSRYSGSSSSSSSSSRSRSSSRGGK